MTAGYQPKTGQPCSCKRGVQRDNCPECEGTGQRIDFAAIRARAATPAPTHCVNLYDNSPQRGKACAELPISRADWCSFCAVTPKTTFTPGGPWRYEPNGQQGTQDHCIWGSQGPGYGAVAAVGNMGLMYSNVQWDEMKANAQLISAAPDLLLALREASRALTELDPLAEHHDAVVIDNALNKAKGEL